MAGKSKEFNRVGECLYRSGNKVYFALLKVSGNQIKKSLKTDDLTLAKRRLTELRSKVGRQDGKESRNIRFEELTERWLASINPTLKPASYARRLVAVAGLTEFFKGKLARSIGYSDIEAWLRRRGSKLAPRTHNIELETLKLIFRYAGERGILLDSPADQFKRRRQPKSIVAIPTHAQFSDLVASMRKSPRAVASGAADMIEFLAYSGMRVGEAREVRVQDVNFGRNTILITGGALGTKNLRQRSIPLFPNLRNLLCQVTARMGDGDTDRKLFTILSPRNAMEAACERIGLKNFTVHSLRHFFASNALEKGINFKTVSEWLGHSDGGVLVARTYGHLREEFSVQMAERMTFAARPLEAATPKIQ
jgi:integrase